MQDGPEYDAFWRFSPLNRLPCYGALEVIVTLLLLLLEEEEEDSPMYNPSGYMQDCHAYNISH